MSPSIKYFVELFELVRVEKLAMFIICPGLPYQETIELVNIVPIVDFITGLCSNTFDTIIKDPEHRLNRLIQFSGPSRYATVGATGASSYLNARQIVLGTVL